VQDFVRSMEQRRLTRKGWHSIFSLMCDGRKLAYRLEKVRLRSKRVKDPFKSVISPYLQFVEPDVTCEHTGLRLSDIWRYFRLTWVNAYKSTPGRSIMVLVRDRAGENHPVIGIAALGNSMVQQEIRDRWIGWTADDFLSRLDREPQARWGRWLIGNLTNLLGGVYVDDLIETGLLKKSDLTRPTIEVIGRLRKEAEIAREQHRLYPKTTFHKSHAKEGRIHWERAVHSHLFRSKRCAFLAKLLSIRLTLSEAGFLKGKSGEIKKLLASSPARSAIGQLVRMVKAEHVGIDMMDITVCGAIAPYNHLLGGKLICLLLTSPEVVAYYNRRYREQESVIASSMKGQSVCRAPRLVLLGTTSLYGVGSSQYNRLKIPCQEVGGVLGSRLEYRRLGLSKGFGSFHFSGTTIELVGTLLGRRIEGRRVNSIFGEGVNPLMRKIREALEELELPSDRILNHGNRRVVYGVALAENFREILLGFEGEPRYLIPPNMEGGGTERLATYWRQRWLTKRVGNQTILEAVTEHTLAYPITHGARVSIYSFQADESETLDLWVKTDQ
jgi:uncharacterized protein DUF4338